MVGATSVLKIDVYTVHVFNIDIKKVYLEILYIDGI